MIKTTNMKTKHEQEELLNRYNNMCNEIDCIAVYLTCLEYRTKEMSSKLAMPIYKNQISFLGLNIQWSLVSKEEKKEHKNWCWSNWSKK